MRPTTSNIFHTSLAVHQSSLTTRTSTQSQYCSTIASCCGTRGIEAFWWCVVSPGLWTIPLGGNA
jgi:hypothetical protein